MLTLAGMARLSSVWEHKGHLDATREGMGCRSAACDREGPENAAIPLAQGGMEEGRREGGEGG